MAMLRRPLIDPLRVLAPPLGRRSILCSGASIPGAGVEIKSYHDQEKFGSPNIDAATKGVRIVDLIRWRMNNPEGTPLKVAANEVIGRLEALGDALKLYRSDLPGHRPKNDGWAYPVEPSELVQVPEVRKQEAGWVQWNDDRSAMVDASWMREFSPLQTQFRQPASQRVVHVKREVSRLLPLRQRLVDKADPRGLDDRHLVPFVIRKSLAEELFGAAERSFWDVVEESEPIDMPAVYPPPELHGLPAHNVSRWGALFTDSTPTRALVRLADLVSYAHGLRPGRPVAEMAGLVQGELAKRDGLRLWRLRKGKRAEEVDCKTEVQPPYPSGREVVDNFRDPNTGAVFYPQFFISIEEADARGLPVTDEDRRNDRLSPEGGLEALPALAAVIGPAGAVELCASRWARLNGLDDLDEGPTASLAILLADAVAMFGRPVPTEQTASLDDSPANAGAAPVQAVPSPVAEALRLVQPDSLDHEREQLALRDRIKAHRPPKKNGNNWIDKIVVVRAELLRQYEERMQIDHADSDTAKQQISDLWGLSKNSIHKYLTDARKDKSKQSASPNGLGKVA